MTVTQVEQPVLSKQQALWMYEKMVTIRKFEDAVHALFAKGKLPGFVHLYAGEEAIATGVCAHLTDQDYITSTHRGHGHCIAKGCDLKGMMAEIYGKATGLCKGKGGSMHIADLEKGMLGANGIVGGGFALATGAALTAKLKNTGQVAVSFFGDGANNQGTFHEGINLASIWKLPVLFVVENNGYAEATPFSYASSCQNIVDRAHGYGIPGRQVDGKDVLAVYQVAQEALERARRGDGPSLIECITYRNYGHFEGDAQKYKTNDDRKLHLTEMDAIRRFTEVMDSRQLAKVEELAEVDARVDTEIEEAIQYAEVSDFPQAEELTTDVYVSY